MNQTLDKLLEVLCAALRADVLPELQSDHSRSQLAGVLDTLAKLPRMIVWSPNVLHEQLAAMCSGVDAILACAEAVGITAPFATMPALSAEARHAELEQAVRAGEQRLADITDWLFDAASTLAPDPRRDMDQLLRDTMRAALIPERRLVAKADFTSMTSSSMDAAGKSSKD